jgi:hypothetical protein
LVPPRALLLLLLMVLLLLPLPLAAVYLGAVEASGLINPWALG